VVVDLGSKMSSLIGKARGLFESKSFKYRYDKNGGDNARDRRPAIDHAMTEKFTRPPRWVTLNRAGIETVINDRDQQNVME